jgi:glycogen phosphorylase
MSILGRVTVLPNLPEPLKRLDELAHNLYWTWSPEARELFRELDNELFEASGSSPVTLLRDISQGRLEQAAQDKTYLASYQKVMKDFDTYQSRTAWFGKTYTGKNHVYAYFCAEYGWHEAVALYSGGLGILAGDHTKAASDVGVPLVGVGLWYPEGYFHQRIAADGQQEAVYQRKSPYDLPLNAVTDKAGKEVRVSVSIQGRDVQLRAWQVLVGRVSVYLLDVDLPENNPEDREVLKRLYGGDQRTRIAQEIILGIGGVRLLRALGIAPTTWHMNEGHSAFMALERCREYVEQGVSFEVAREIVASNTVFTVHTPVAAGNDAFPFDLVGQYFGGFWGGLGLNQQAFYDLAKHDIGWGPMFSMPALALRFSSGRNGVAELHGDTSRRIWNDLWSDVPTEEVPIGHITNGVHSATWVAPELQDIFGTVLPQDWLEHVEDNDMWQRVKNLDNAALWQVRKTVKDRSLRFLRRRVRRQLTRHGVTPTVMHSAQELFDAGTLTIGFARRFATYKRATLIFRDLDRLANILNNPAMPVQLVFAGKAHPADKPGQSLIKEIDNLSKDPRFAGKLLFVEDYDMAIGRALTRGVDVWLNNPRRPLEASGTSGQKAAMNGILNLSILDGWWPEGFDGINGWAIGDGSSNAVVDGENSEEKIDAADADALYDLLEREVVPLYYQRDQAAVPNDWLERSKDAIATIAPKFSAQRMVQDYVNTYYAPASERFAAMSVNNHEAATMLAAWRKDVSQNWHSVYLSARAAEDKIHQIGDELDLEAVLHPKDLGIGKDLGATELCVEVVYGLEQDGLEHNLRHVPMTRQETFPDGAQHYRARFKPELSGRLVYGVRVYPVNKSLASPFDGHAVRWAVPDVTPRVLEVSKNKVQGGQNQVAGSENKQQAPELERSH